jgi:hypothetical protein
MNPNRAMSVPKIADSISRKDCTVCKMDNTRDAKDTTILGQLFFWSSETHRVLDQRETQNVRIKAQQRRAEHARKSRPSAWRQEGEAA